MSESFSRFFDNCHIIELPSKFLTKVKCIRHSELDVFLCICHYCEEFYSSDEAVNNGRITHLNDHFSHYD